MRGGEWDGGDGGFGSRIPPAGRGCPGRTRCYKGDGDRDQARTTCAPNVLAKLFGLVLGTRLSHLAVVNGVISPAQAGFVVMHGCESHIFTLLETLRHRVRQVGPGHRLGVRGLQEGVRLRLAAVGVGAWASPTASSRCSRRGRLSPYVTAHGR